MISKKDVLKLETRKKIYDFIEKNPSLNIREISRQIDIPVTTLVYHIQHLRKFGIINETLDGKCTRICISEKLGTLDKQILSLLRNKNSCKILLYLIWGVTFSQIELSKELNLPPPTVSYYLKKMVKMGLLEEAPVMGDKIYAYTNNIDRPIKRKPIKSEKFYKRTTQEVANSTYKLIITHKSKLFDEKIIDSFIDYYDECEKKPKKRTNPVCTTDTQIDELADCFYLIFPPHFCS